MRIFRLVSGAAAALALVAGLAVADPAAARDRDRMSPGAAVAVGVLGGLAVGTIVGATVAQQPAYAAPAPIYAAPPPPPPVYRAPRRPAHVHSETVYYSRPAPPPVVVERCVTKQYDEWVPGYGWETRTRKTCRR